MTRTRQQRLLVVARLGLSVLVLAACAPLNTSRMSESCRQQYNACLSGCPRYPPCEGNNCGAQFDVAACTDGCNNQAKSCHVSP